MPLYEVISVIPEVFAPYVGASVLGRALSRGVFEFAAHDLREWTHDRHRTVDDAPFGGGPGMLMKPEPVYEAVEDLSARGDVRPRVVMFSPCGRTLSQADVARLAAEPRLLMVCGRYEGMDERVYRLADEVVSLGDFVLTGAELAAMALLDAVVRLLPGALGDERSAREESFSDGLLEYAQYTRPAEFRGMGVPEVLLSGDHGAVDAWRRADAVRRTARWRPDLLEAAGVSPDEVERALSGEAR